MGLQIHFGTRESGHNKIPATCRCHIMHGAPRHLGAVQQGSTKGHSIVCPKQPARSDRGKHVSCHYLRYTGSLQPLQRLVGAQPFEELVGRHPELLTLELSSPVTSWVDFWHEYGLDENAIGKLLLQCPELISCTSIYEAGRTLLFFRHLGWKNEQIRGRIIAQYPQVCAYTSACLACSHAS
eukprot:GHUV01054169.1.p1 GENE.GHUV01054169.1~~GHUV01054169.1.p1  ORF type:complete len:182 (-),score=9.64 GHUV01054169.1:165-710(-)